MAARDQLRQQPAGLVGCDILDGRHPGEVRRGRAMLVCVPATEK